MPDGKPKITRRQFTTGLVASALLCRSGLAASRVMETRKQNILLILADDLGYSDIGCYGSEIETPNIDSIANEGLRLSGFYNCAVCVPTRGSLLTGLYPHQVNCGDDWGPMRIGVSTIAERLRDCGYRTLLSGKWHLGEKPGYLPTDRGFHSFFGLTGGAKSYFSASNLLQGRQPYNGPTEDFYLTDAITEQAISMMRSSIDDREPFFQMVTYTAPHFPLQAPVADIEKYRGKYVAGWDVLRLERFRRMVNLGIVRSDWKLPSRSELDPDVSWERLTASEKDGEDLRMAVYAAQVDRMDQGVGHILNFLRSRGELDRTVVIFMSDNGACSAKLYQTLSGQKAKGIPPGPENSWDAYGLPWANVSNTPFRLYKSWLHEGGISTPFIVRHPSLVSGNGSIQHRNIGHVVDLWPTLLEIAGSSGTRNSDENEVHEGVSLLPAFRGHPVVREFPLCWSQWGGHATRIGDWKIVKMGAEASTNRLNRYGYHPAGTLDRWELYNIPRDRTETRDMALERPEIVRDLRSGFDRWASRTQLYHQKTRTNM
jgi:arylsulfatase A-like enzyme